MRVLVCGGREWVDYLTIKKRLAQLPKDTVIIHGAARGADYLAGDVARVLGLGLAVYPAEWDKYGKAAGAIRNREMLDLGPDLVIAFHSDLEQSKGTKDCVTEARRRGIPVEVIS